MSKFSVNPDTFPPANYDFSVRSIPSLYVQGMPIDRTDRRIMIENIIIEWYRKEHNFCVLQGWQREFKNGYALFCAVNNVINGQINKDKSVARYGLNAQFNPKLLIWWKPQMPNYIALYREGKTQPVTYRYRDEITWEKLDSMPTV